MFRGQAINSTHGGIRIQECVKESLSLQSVWQRGASPSLFQAQKSCDRGTLREEFFKAQDCAFLTASDTESEKPWTCNVNFFVVLVVSFSLTPRQVQINLSVPQGCGPSKDLLSFPSLVAAYCRQSGIRFCFSLFARVGIASQDPLVII